MTLFSGIAGSRGKFVMSVFCEGGTREGTGREAERNIVIGELGHAAWRGWRRPER